MLNLEGIGRILMKEKLSNVGRKAKVGKTTCIVPIIPLCI